MSEPITVPIRREVDPERITEATVWVQTGVNLATKYPGFLGCGWVRAGEDSQIWHMLYRFANEESLVAWEKSSEREWWLSMGEGFVRSERSKRRTGIEGWFDEPTNGTITAPSADGGTTTVAVIARLLLPQPSLHLCDAPGPRLGCATALAAGAYHDRRAHPDLTHWVLPFVTRSLRVWRAR